MKIGKLSYILSAFVAFSAFTACDSIDEDERYVSGDAVVAKRNVLIEDFTGQNCVNCPDAHEVINSLKENENGKFIIAVSIHAGSSAIATPIGLKTSEGDEYANKWNIMSYPKGIINRKVPALDYEGWAAFINKELEKKTLLNIELYASFSEKDTLLIVNTVMQPLEDIDGKLQLWITESNITKRQQMPNGINNPDYVHNHVFRSSINGTWGEDVTLTANIRSTKQNTMKISSHRDDSTPLGKLNYWNVENLSIVAFVYNDKDGVLQVVETPIDLNVENK